MGKGISRCLPEQSENGIASKLHAEIAALKKFSDSVNFDVSDLYKRQILFYTRKNRLHVQAVLSVGPFISKKVCQDFSVCAYIRVERKAQRR